MGRRAAGCVRLIALGWSLLAVAAFAQEYPGVPIGGHPGIAVATADLMARQRAIDAAQASQPQRVRHRPVLRPNRENLPGGPGAEVPAAPAIESPATPASRAIHTPSSTNFTGATLADTGAFPPDSMGTVGPTQFVVAINGRIRSFTKAGVADGVLDVDPDVFFASVMTPPPAGGVTFTSDPRIRYDRFTSRWLIEIIDVPCADSGCATTANNRVLIAVSDGPTITLSTVWTFYRFQAGGGNFADYCTLGVDVNALYVGCNMFSTAGAFVGTDGYVVRKSSVTGGGPIVVTAFVGLVPGAAGAGPFTPQGVDNFDRTATEGFFVGVDNATFSTLMVRRVNSPGGTPTISANISLAVPATSYPKTVPHLGNTGGTNGNLDGLDDRLYAAHVRNGRLWTAHSILVTSAGVATSSGTTGRNGVRWYEIQNVTTTPTLVQSGTIFDSAATVAAAKWYWIPTIHATGQGHAVAGFSGAGTNFRADAYFTGRLASDAVGSMAVPAAYTASASAYNPASDPGGAGGRRWGDYSYTSVDPLDDMTVWTVQEFANATNSYGVQVAKLNAPPPATIAAVSPAAVNAGQASVNVVVTGTSVGGSGFFDPGPDLPAPALPFTHISASVTGGVVVNSVTYDSPTQVTLNLSTLNASSGPQSVTVTNPDGQSVTGADILTINPDGLFRTYLSASGNDLNPCTVVAPCRLLPAALAAVKTGGEVWILDSANYNTAQVDVTRSVTILAIPGVLGSLVGNGGDAIRVNGAAAMVSLRNLNIVDLSGGFNGVNFVQGLELTLDQCEIYGMGESGIRAAASGGRLMVRNSVLRGNGNYGVHVEGTVSANLEGVRMLGNSLAGLLAANGAQVTLANSVSADNGTFGASAQANGGYTTKLAIEGTVLRSNVGSGVDGFANGSGDVAQVTVSGNAISHNGSGVYASANAGGTVTMVLGGNTIGNNATGVNFAGAGAKTVYSRQDNTISGNGTNVSGGSLTAATGL
jgi:hypothetical protein